MCQATAGVRGRALLYIAGRFCYFPRPPAIRRAFLFDEESMAYKYKPSKSVAKRFGVTKNGKLKRGHSLTSHLRSSRSSKKKRHLRRPEVLFEGHARNMRRFMGLSKLKPAKLAHERALAAKKADAQAPNAEG
jgi:large subunit ribosomal protein L35